MVKRELKSGKIYEDLIFGLKMGQTRRHFFEHCWQLNKKKIISQGPGNQFAKHIMLLDSTVENSKKVEMLFYGIFDEQEIMHGMHMKMNYTQWAPWNEDFQAEVLLKDLEKKYMKQYGGNPFIEITIDEDIKAYSKIDGNREILVYPTSAKEVTVKIRDLREKYGDKLRH